MNHAYFNSVCLCWEKRIVTASRHQLRHGYSRLKANTTIPDIAFTHSIQSLADNNIFFSLTSQYIISMTRIACYCYSLKRLLAKHCKMTWLSYPQDPAESNNFNIWSRSMLWIMNIKKHNRTPAALSCKMQNFQYFNVCIKQLMVTYFCSLWKILGI